MNFLRKFKEIISVALIFTLLFTVSTFSPYAADDKNEVYIGGEAFGVKFYANGAMIIKLESYYDGEKYVCPAKDAKNRQTTGQMRFAVSGYKTGNRRPSFCIPWGIFCRTGVLAWLGIGSLRVDGLCRAGWKCLRPKTVRCRCWQQHCCAAGRCGCKMCRA